MQPAPLPAAVILIHKCVCRPTRPTDILGSSRLSRFELGTLRAPSSVLPTQKMLLYPLSQCLRLSVGGNRKTKKADRLRQPMAPMSRGRGANAERAVLADATNPGSPSIQHIQGKEQNTFLTMRNDKLKPHLPICLVTASPISVGPCEGVLSSHPPPFHVNCRRHRLI